MKYDIKKNLDIYKVKYGKDTILKLKPMNAIMISGKGAPGSEAFKKAIEKLYPLAYKAKFDFKSEDKDFVIPPLSGLWYADDMTVYVDDKRDEWKWDLFIPFPEFVTKTYVNKLVKGTEVKSTKIELGEVVVTLHVGPYSEEGPVIQKMHQYAFDNDKIIYGKQLEIYIGDPRRSAPEKLKTVLGQQIK